MNKINTKKLKITDISKGYKQGSIIANRDISFELLSSEVTALIGHNGAGKSTLLNQIMGLVKPDKGEILYDGTSLTKNPKLARNLVSFMPQFHAPLAGVTVQQAIESVLLIHGFRKKDIQTKVNHILTVLDIEQWASVSGEKLSGGLQRLTSFAMAVVNPSPIILLDEPTNDVDPVRRKYMWIYIKELAKSGSVVVVITHNLLEVEQYTDRFILLEHGTLRQDERTSNVQKNETSTLTITTLEDYEFRDLPNAMDITELKKESQLILALRSEETIEAIEWVLKHIKEGNILSYKLASSSLNTFYGGADNDE